MDINTLNIPPEVKQEIEDFASEVERLNTGKVGEEDFKRFRLQQGIYGQRQENVQMIRMKIPSGTMTSDQINCLADFADNYSNGILHVTTRQDIQFHYVKLENVAKGLEDFAKHDLTTREACGNTVRNVTACHKAGTCAEEPFDVTPYANAASKHLLRHSVTQNLPRKFKISFGGCGGCALSAINDIGANAVVRKENGQEIRGFRMVVGGGLGSSPHSAQLYSEFVPASDLLRTCEAIVRTFDKHGDKRNRNKARFKFVVDKHGIEKVKELIKEEFDGLEGATFDKIEVPEESIPNIPEFTPNNEFDADPDYENWKARNISEQKQKGYFNAEVKLTLGDMDSSQARIISKMVSDCAGGYIVNTASQNLVIPWVKPEAFGLIYSGLKNIGLHKAGTEELRDITCCPGSETCNLGITASRGLAVHVSKDIENNYTSSPELDHITIKTSGCPNSCGQHHIAAIGFSGSAKKVNGVLAPHYEMMLGGRISEEGAVFGTSIIKLPAKNVPNAVRITIDGYKKDKQGSESFPEFFDRMGKGYFVDMLSTMKDLPEIEASPNSYIDFGTDKKFSLEDRGQGECAGAVTDMISDHLSEAERALYQSKRALETGDFPESTRLANRSLVSCSRALLVTEGMDFSDNIESLKKFESLIVETGIVSEIHADITSRYQEDSTSANEAMAKARSDEADLLVQECKKTQDKMQTDKSLRIRVGANGGNGDKPKEESSNGSKSLAIDLIGIKCPFNYVKTKLKLETMQVGQSLEVLLDDGDPIKNVPRSVQNDGHKLLSQEKVDEHYKIVIEKV
ncbi:MAG: sulfurtransferase TusA family protein [Nitrospinales bacterium]